VWRATGSTARGLLSSVVYGALVVGGLGFSAGFFGPMLLSPDGSQGPLLGLFITGPVGFVVGAIGGAIVWGVRRALRPFDRLRVVLSNVEGRQAQSRSAAGDP
jgi:hypothetical protein